jgi:hypothetical protein
MGEQEWQDAGCRWQGKDGTLRLQGWSRPALKKFLRGRKLVPPRQLQPAGSASYG